MIFFKSMQKSTSFSQGLYMLSSAFPPHQNYRSVPEYMNNLFIGFNLFNLLVLKVTSYSFLSLSTFTNFDSENCLKSTLSISVYVKLIKPVVIKNETKLSANILYANMQTLT